MFKTKQFWCGLSCLGVCVMLIGNSAGTILEKNRNMVNSYLGTQTAVVEVSESDDALYTTYVADYANTDELIAAHRAMGERLSAEGSVLLKNNGALPLEKGSAVTLLGVCAETKMNFGARVGCAVKPGQNVKLGDALIEKGFQVNEQMRETYTKVCKNKVYNNANKLSPSFVGVLPGNEPKLVTAEATVEEIQKADSDYRNGFAAYQDAAIVVLGRCGTEAADYYPSETGIDPQTGARNALALTNDERALLALAKENFHRVVVLLNTANPMEIGELAADDGIDAILWIGCPGNYGTLGIASILCGETNPLGALPDVYASNSVSSPAMANFGIYTFANADEYFDTVTDRADYYLIEAEGIYTGYRYYETRYADAVMGQGNADSTVGAFDSAAGWNYGEEVTYPFGYGVSYTTFRQTLDAVTVSQQDKTVTAAVTVTNTGSVPGKSTVQLYMQAPYYVGGLEKSAVQLLDFGKTKLLAAGESETLTITADMQNMTSYDADRETYLLDAGEYYFAVGCGAHEALNSILTAQGYAERLDGQGDIACVKTWTLAECDTTTFAVTKAGVQVSNQLADADFNAFQPGTVTYLSRSDWAGTWPKNYENLTATAEMLATLKNDFYTIHTDDDVSDIIWGADNGMSFADMKGAAYDDPRWEKLLDQLTIQEAAEFVSTGNMIYLDIPSVGFLGGTLANDGPVGFLSSISNVSDANSPWYVSPEDPNAGYEVHDMGTPQLVGASFDKELAQAIGTLFGNDSLFNGLSIIWGPGLNLHRTPCCGRNVEYYSEDPVLSGFLAAAYAQGAYSKGLIAAGKHFAFNDQETNRNGVAPFMTEQKARELELRSFQIAFENGMLGTMTAFNRIGTTYVSAHEGLIDGILRGEWGFQGYIVTDLVNPATYMTWKESVAAGTTNFDSVDIKEEWYAYLNHDGNTLGGDAKILRRLKEAVHHTLYVLANSNRMNAVNTSAKMVEVSNWWRVSYRTAKIGGFAAACAGLLGYVAICCISIMAKKKEERTA